MQISAEENECETVARMKKMKKKIFVTKITRHYIYVLARENKERAIVPLSSHHHWHQRRRRRQQQQQQQPRHQQSANRTKTEQALSNFFLLFNLLRTGEHVVVFFVSRSATKIYRDKLLHTEHKAPSMEHRTLAENSTRQALIHREQRTRIRYTPRVYAVDETSRSMYT